MPRPSILMLEQDPASEQVLNDVLAAAGFEVYAADSFDSVVRAVTATPFPALLFDADQAGVRPDLIVQKVHEIRPETAVIFTGRDSAAPRILEMLRAGAADFLAKPIQPRLAAERVRDVLARDQARRAGMRHLRARAEAAEQELARVERSGASRVSGLDDQLILAFARGALQTFLDIEKQSAELERTANAQADGANRTLQAWIMHQDASFVGGMLSLAGRAGLEFKPPLTSGGEVLDRLSAASPDLLMLGDAMPDIPTQLVLETIKSQHPDVEVLIIEGWGTPARSGVLVSGTNPTEIRRPLAKADDILALVQIARERSADVSFSREFAERFRDRHKEFLRRYAEVMKRLNAV